MNLADVAYFAPAGLIIAVLLVIYFQSAPHSVALTPIGGISAAGTLSATTPLPKDGTTATIATTTPSCLTKKIIILKDMPLTHPPGLGGAAEYLHIGEIHAYAESPSGEDIALTRNDYSSAASATHSWFLGVPVARMMLELRTPMRLTKINVLSRQDCCLSRLNGAVIVLKDENDVEIFRKVLSSERELRLVPAE